MLTAAGRSLVRNRVRATAGAGVLALLVAAMTGVAQGSVQASSPLTGKIWILSKLGAKSPVAGTQVSVEFAKGQVTGSGGCNRFGGTYTTSGSTIRIMLGPTTQIACSPKIDAQERAFFGVLSRARAFAVSGSTLTLKGSTGKVLATFKAQSQALGGSSWEVIAYNNGKEAVVSVLAEPTLTAVFGKDGNLSGFAGCNTYNGPYTAKPPKLTIGPVAATRKACADPELTEQEARYLAALGTVTSYRVTGSRLELRTASGALAVDLRRA